MPSFIWILLIHAVIYALFSAAYQRQEAKRHAQNDAD